MPKLSTDPVLLEGMDASVRVLMKQLEKGYYIYGSWHHVSMYVVEKMTDYWEQESIPGLGAAPIVVPVDLHLSSLHSSNTPRQESS